jgi:hypothetical protein
VSHFCREGRGVKTHLVPRCELQIHVFADGRRRAVGPRFVAFLLTELGPRLAFGDGVRHCGCLEGALCLARDLARSGGECWRKGKGRRHGSHIL